MANNIYSMEITLKGQPRILTIQVSEKSMDIMLSDMQGNEIEYLSQQGNKIKIEKPK